MKTEIGSSIHTGPRAASGGLAEVGAPDVVVRLCVAGLAPDNIVGGIDDAVLVVVTGEAGGDKAQYARCINSARTPTVTSSITDNGLLTKTGSGVLDTVPRGRRGTVELSRSGGVKVMTVFLGASRTDGNSFIYSLSGNQFRIVSGMLDNHQSLPEIELRVYNRIATTDLP